MDAGKRPSQLEDAHHQALAIQISSVRRPVYASQVIGPRSTISSGLPTPVDLQFAEITVEDFARIQDFWDPALPEERAVLLGSFAEKLYEDFETGQLLEEVVPKSGFRYLLEAAQIVRAPRPLS